jgi:predicted Na+-dependent transporter
VVIFKLGAQLYLQLEYLCLKRLLKMKSKYDSVTIKGIVGLIVMWLLVIGAHLNPDVSGWYTFVVVIIILIAFYYAGMFLFRITNPIEYERYMRFKDK